MANHGQSCPVCHGGPVEPEMNPLRGTCNNCQHRYHRYGTDGLWISNDRPPLTNDHGPTSEDH